MAFYKCDIARVSSGETGAVSLQLKTLDPPPPFPDPPPAPTSPENDWRWFTYQGANSKEVLAVALAALSADLTVGVELESTKEGSPIKGSVFAAKRFTIPW